MQSIKIQNQKVKGHGLKVKGLEASRSSFLKLVFSKTQPYRGHAKNTTQTYIYSWLT